MCAERRATAEVERERLNHVRLRRVLIDLSFKGVGRNAVSLPIWALLLNLLFSGIAPEIGTTPLSNSWVWVAACTLVAALTYLLKYRFDRVYHRDDFSIRPWYAYLLALHIAIGFAWSLAIWIHWQPMNPANHMFLFVIAIGCAALYGVVRSGDFNVPLAGTLPLFATLWLFAMQRDLWVDNVLSVLLPLWYIQFLGDTLSNCKIIENSHRAQSELELLAADNARARDEAEAHRAGALRANASKSAFIANMSHELRTPLNAILGFSEIIASGRLGPAAQQRYRDYAADINASGRHLLSLVNDMLDIAKIEAGRLKLNREWLDGQPLLSESVRAIEDRANAKRVLLRVGEESVGVRLFADERAFKQILLNLLSNAVKFTDKGWVSVTLKVAKPGVTLVVEDTGCGIPRPQLERVFQPFEQIDNRYSRQNAGTGLGLTLVRALADLHGGSCRIESEEGQGTRVEVLLPYPAEASADAEDRSASRVA